MLNRRGAVVLFIVLAAWLLLQFPITARAHDHSTMGATGKFYSTWMMPDAPHVSCCNQNDCAPALKARQDPMGIWHAQRESDGKWFMIPPEKVVTSPDGRSHLCVLNDRVLCFVAGSGI